jgi:hypothetical protein
MICSNSLQLTIPLFFQNKIIKVAIEIEVTGRQTDIHNLPVLRYLIPPLILMDKDAMDRGITIVVMTTVAIVTMRAFMKSFPKIDNNNNNNNNNNLIMMEIEGKVMFTHNNTNSSQFINKISSNTNSNINNSHNIIINISSSSNNNISKIKITALFKSMCIEMTGTATMTGTVRKEKTRK